MKLLEAIENRRSIRAFKPDPVPKDMIQKILAHALKAPSAMNSQPYGMVVASGGLLDKIKSDNADLLASGEKPSPDIPRIPYPGKYRECQKDLAARLFKALDIEWGDKEKRAKWRQTGFRFYESPVALILHIDSTVDQSQALIALGALCQNICLAALEYGLGTCIHDMGVAFPKVIRRHTDIAEDRHIVIAISIGYPAPDMPVNEIKVNRRPLEDFVQWLVEN